jgi:hypothetical protein
VAKKSTEIVPTMLRIREDLRKRLEREAKKRDHSLNAEMVERLEKSFSNDEKSRRDSEILDMLLGFTAANSDMKELFRHITIELATRPFELGTADMQQIGLRFFELLEPYRQRHLAEKNSQKDPPISVLPEEEKK